MEQQIFEKLLMARELVGEVYSDVYELTLTQRAELHYRLTGALDEIDSALNYLKEENENEHS